MTSPLSNRLFPVLAGLAVAALTCAAFALSYEDLRQLALAGLDGRLARRFAPAYPAVYGGLVVTVLLALFVARNSRWWVRWPRWLLLYALVAGAIAASVQRGLKGYEPLDDTWVTAGVASAPWVAALIAVWLWMSMFKQLKANGNGLLRPTSRRQKALKHKPAHARTDPADMIPGFSPIALPPVAEKAPAVDEAAEEQEPEPEPAQEYKIVLQKEPEPVRPPSSLPTDVMLVGRPKQPIEKVSETTQPDFIPVVAEAPDVPETADTPDAPEAPEDEVVERAEDPDAGTDDWAAYAPEWNPPSSSIRSGPTPPSE
jgi:hypothetical protein